MTASFLFGISSIIPKLRSLLTTIVPFCALYFAALPISGFLVGYTIERISLVSLRQRSSSSLPWWNAWIQTISAVLVVHTLIFVQESFSNTSTSTNDFLRMFFLRLISFSLGVAIGSSFQPVGLTGGIACGKSTVSSMLSQSNRFTIIDVDKISHDILDGNKISEYGRDSAYLDIVRVFGRDILLEPSKGDLHPQIDRAKLGEVIFRDPKKRRLLNKLTHTRILRCMLKRMVMEHFRSPSGVVVVDIPLLFEAGFWMKWLFRYIVVVATSPSSLQLKRLQSRNPELTADQCQQRISSQYSIESKVSKADFVVWNNEITLAQLHDNVMAAQEKILNLYTNWSRTLGCVSFVWMYALLVAYYTLMLP